MRYEKIKNINDPFFKKTWEIYCSNFPLEERRDLIEQKNVFEEHSNNIIEEKNIFVFNAIVKKDKNEVVGMIGYWLFPNSIFIEHLAINQQMQGLGIGKIAIDHIKEIYDHCKLPIILEIETPTDYITKRRESFYKKLGFIENPFEHFQPIYHLGDEPVEMVIMTFPYAINEQSYLEFKDYQQEIMPKF